MGEALHRPIVRRFPGVGTTGMHCGQDERVIIVGGPRVGKSTMARQMSGDSPSRVNGPSKSRCTDELIGAASWSGSSEETALWFNEPGPWVIEGVATARALRKWLQTHDGKPCERIAVLRKPKVKATPGQLAMGKGVLTVFRQIRRELERRKVLIEVEK